jgi:Domain of unknown function (DUF4340)
VNDNQRTVAYCVVAVLAGIVAIEPWSRRHAAPTALEETGKLFPDFKDPRDASSMSIVKYDEATGSLHPFQVARVGGVWSIPSHQNYPADAQQHLGQAATTLIGLEILGVASTKPGEHELYGVLDPDPKTVGPGSVGVGSRVTMKDGQDNTLADLIIGKEVKDQPGLRYVRKAGRDQVYRVLIQTDKLSTKFGDWIEKDLLKLNPLDIRSVQLNDYSSGAGRTADGRIGVERELRNQIILDYDDTKNAWTVGKLIQYDANEKPVPADLEENEELNNEKLSALKTALDDLQIVDVERKPAGMKQLTLSAEVPVEQLRAQLGSLFQRGFFPLQNRNKSFDLVSSEGEAIISMKDGVQYVLRFGQVAQSDENKEEPAQDPADKKAPGSRLNRYLFVMAQFDPDLIAKPTLEALPGDDDAEKPADEDKDKPAADADKKPADDKPAADADKPAADADEKAKQTKEEDEAERKKIEAEKRAVVERDNKRKQDEYDEKLKKGEEHVKELNDRFADWYYIISDDVYHKIHLGRADVVKSKDAKPGEGNTPADLDAIQRQGLGN